MPQYSCAFRVLTANANTPIFEVRSSATDYTLITELGISVYLPNTVSAYGLGVPQAAGISPKTSLAFTPNDPNSNPTSLSIATDWAAPPTSPTTFVRRGTPQKSSSMAGNTMVFKFPRGLGLSPGSSLVLWPTAWVQNQLYDVWIEADV